MRSVAVGLDIEESITCLQERLRRQLTTKTHTWHQRRRVIYLVVTNVTGTTKVTDMTRVTEMTKMIA